MENEHSEVISETTPVIPLTGDNPESSLPDDSAEKVSLGHVGDEHAIKKIKELDNADNENKEDTNKGEKQSNDEEEEALAKNISRESSRGNFLVQTSTTSNHAEQGTY